MAVGNHLVVNFGTYTHHGIELGNGFVVHYGRPGSDKRHARVEVVGWDNFSGGHPVHRIHDVPLYRGTQITDRAMSRLGEDRYDLFQNNCEHFVNWCRHGVANSKQANRFDLVGRKAAAATSKMMWPLVARSTFSKTLARGICKPFVTNTALSKWAIPAALVGDLVQLSAEAAAIENGIDPEKSKKFGQKSGAVASGGIGYLTGGPAGAVAGVAAWCAGECFGLHVIKSTQNVIRGIWYRPSRATR